MLNNVPLTGRLTRDVDLRYTQSGTAVGSFTLAVDRAWVLGIWHVEQTSEIVKLEVEK